MQNAAELIGILQAISIVAKNLAEYFPAWEPSVSRLRAIKKFLPSEPP